MGPKDYLTYYSKVYPSAWKQVDDFRSQRGKALPFWPDWCFMPLAGAMAIVTSEVEKQGIGEISDPIMNDQLGRDVGILGALAAWRVTQGIYRFDSDVFQEIFNTPITGNLPHDILFRLPEWCLYIETPDTTWLNSPLHGFFVHLEYDVGTGRKELRFVFDQTPDSMPMLFPFVLHLGDWPLKESITRTMDEAKKQSKAHGIEKTFPEESKLLGEIKDLITPFVSLVLYLCSINAEFSGIPEKPKPKKTKKGYRLFAPPQPRTWDVGIRLGASLRAAKTEYVESKDIEEGQRRPPRPHIRRAHWHLYWTGEGRKNPVVKWLPPTPIGIQEDLPVTIYPVK